MPDVEIDGYYRRQAKDLVNMLFDKRFLNDSLSRESIDWLEEFIAFLFQSHCQQAAQIALLTERRRDRDRKPK